MSFQAYIDNIQQKTGKTPDDFHTVAKKEGILRTEMKAMEFVNWLKTDFGLGHGHAMAMLEYFKRQEWINLSTKRGKK